MPAVHVAAHLVICIGGLVVARSKCNVVKTERLSVSIVCILIFHRCLFLLAFVYQSLGLSNLDIAERKKSLPSPRQRVRAIIK